MLRHLFFLLVLAAACGNSDNVIVGTARAGATTPDIIFDSIGSSIHGLVTLSDPSGAPQGAQMAVVIMSNVPSLCARLKAKPDYFRNPPEAYEALILIAPGGKLGTFIIGRTGDQGTQAEIVAVSGPQAPTPFVAATGSYIALTNWPDNGGNATGSFNMGFDDPYGSGFLHPFAGRFKASFCPTLGGTLLP